MKKHIYTLAIIASVIIGSIASTALANSKPTFVAPSTRSSATKASMTAKAALFSSYGMTIAYCGATAAFVNPVTIAAGLAIALSGAAAAYTINKTPISPTLVSV